MNWNMPHITVESTTRAINCRSMFTRGPRCMVCDDRPSQHKVTLKPEVKGKNRHKILGYLCATHAGEGAFLKIPYHIPESQRARYVKVKIRS